MTRAEFIEFVRAAKSGVVATVDAEGHPEAALVDLAVTDHGEVLFDTKLAPARSSTSASKLPQRLTHPSGRGSPRRPG